MKNYIQILLLLTIIFFGSCSSSKQEITDRELQQDYLKQAESLSLDYQNNKYQNENTKQEAINSYIKSAELYPNTRVKSYIGISKLYFKNPNPDFSMANNYLTKALNEDKYNEEALILKIKIITATKGFRLAITETENILKTNQSENIYLVLYWLKARYSQDTTDIRKNLIKMKIRNSDFYNTLALIELKDKNIEKARYLAIKGQETNKSDARGYAIQAIVDIKENNIYSAKFTAEKGLALNNLSYYLLNTHAGIMLKQGNLSLAEKSLKQAIKMAPADLDIVNNLANLYSLKEERAKAKELYKKAISIDPDYPNTYFNYANMLLSDAKKEEALQQFKQFVAKKIFGLNRKHRVYKLIKKLENEVL